MNWFFIGLKKSAVFSGRAHRREFWFFALVASLIALVLWGLDIASNTYDREAGMGRLTAIFLVATLLPSMSISVRRLHDTGKSGWWWLVSLIPFIGAIILLILCAQPGDSGSNAYGADPQEAPLAPEEDFIATLLCGRWGLAKTFWLFGVVGTLAFHGVLYGLVVSTQLAGVAIAAALAKLAFAAMVCEAVINAAPSFAGPRVWSVLARSAAIVALCISVAWYFGLIHAPS